MHSLNRPIKKNKFLAVTRATRDVILKKPRSSGDENVTDGNSYCFKFLRLRRKPEVRDSRTSCFRTLPELSIRGAGQKDRSSGDENANMAEIFTGGRVCVVSRPRLNEMFQPLFSLEFSSLPE